MDFKTKRQSKKYAKQCFRIAYAFVIFFFLSVAAGVIIILATPVVTNHESRGDFWMMLLFISPLFIGLGFGIFGQYFIDIRRKYKAQILEYRQKRFFTQTMSLITSGNLNEAIDVYNYLVTKSNYRDFLYSYFICELLHSTNEVQRKRGEKILASVLQKTDPNDIKF